MKQWEVWFAEFPYEENPLITKRRPVIILDAQTLECLSIKVTSQDIRHGDEYDTPITYWREAGLKKPSVARVSKTMKLSNDKFRNKVGTLRNDDIDIIMHKFMDFINNQ